MVTAGSDKNGFDTKLLFAKMYGSRMPAEARRLQDMYGPLPVTNFFTLMNFTVADVLRMVKRDKVALPAADDPIVPEQLDSSLVAAGIVPSGHRAGRYDVGYMIERLISHPYHHELMMDLYRKYPAREVASFHTVLGQVVKDSVPRSMVRSSMMRSRQPAHMATPGAATAGPATPQPVQSSVQPSGPSPGPAASSQPR
ncbi:MAG: hypothetical protein GIX01_10905 [Candidatus Eremiobacteraeota bacterium]|nr:hypothetical protein [Candidatus Eremiobacteraeota bacterium]